MRAPYVFVTNALRTTEIESLFVFRCFVVADELAGSLATNTIAMLLAMADFC